MGFTEPKDRCTSCRWSFFPSTYLVVVGKRGLFFQHSRRNKRQELQPANTSEPIPPSKGGEALNYFQKQLRQITCVEYRTSRLPMTSAHNESTIKQLSRWGRGTEKFWSRNDAPIIQLRANFLSETEPMKKILE
jgi:hypothetical protein